MEAFITVFEEGSYTSAAKRLGRTKAMVSTQVSQLEAHLQIRLMTRSTRSIQATAMGRTYYEQAKLLLEDLDNLESQLTQSSQNVAGKLRIAVPTTYGEQVVMPFVAKLIETYPELEIDILLSDRYVDLINEGVDAAIRIGRLEDSSLIASHIGKVNMMLCASQAFLESYPTPKQFSDLSDLPCVLDDNSRENYWSFEAIENQDILGRNNKKGRIESRVKVTPNYKIRVNSASAAVQLARHGKLICYTPAFAAQDLINQGLLIPILAKAHQTHFPIQIVYPHRKHTSARLTQFIAEFKAYLTEQKVK
ncbi:probable transcription regulator protein [Marinomonas sp. MED121]|uniref:LysR family transcriptional regulator n=1 Tax=Marinomonas sp. MED121 TaxID=314277 RepID=UPI0000690A47|nr:LysR family transcriptional regulator [Marinomonas sp. MED121]EAQ64060.1 probable transcription regulator protein [Marinomonas sp. MED121]